MCVWSKFLFLLLVICSMVVKFPLGKCSVACTRCQVLVSLKELDVGSACFVRCHSFGRSTSLHVPFVDFRERSTPCTSYHRSTLWDFSISCLRELFTSYIQCSMRFFFFTIGLRVSSFLFLGAFSISFFLIFFFFSLLFFFLTFFCSLFIVVFTFHFLRQ
jgi:hypothetical protein